MNAYQLKLKHILPPFVAVTLGTVIAFGILRWILSIKFSIVGIKEDVWEFWLPLLLPGLPIRLWLNARFKRLTFKVESEISRFFYHFIAWGTMTVMLCVSQAYLTTATGSLRTLSTIEDIDQTDAARYYKVDDFSVVPSYGGTHAKVSKSGKYGTDLNFDVYFVTPVVSANTARLSRIPKVWYAVHFSEQTSNWTSKAEKEKRYRVFFNKSLAKMNNYNFHDLDHFERLPASSNRDNYLKAIQSRVNAPEFHDFIVLRPIQDKYEDRNGQKVAWIFRAFAIGLAVLMLALIRPSLSDPES